MNDSGSSVFRTFIPVLVVIGLLALALSGYLNPLIRTTVNPLVIAQTWLSSRYMALHDFLTVPRDVNSLRQQNALLQAEVTQLQAQVIELQQEKSETQILYALLGFAQKHPENQYMAATIIGRDPSPFLQYVIINRGSDVGMRRGMPVVTQNGLVGRIDAVGPAASRVQLISDASSTVNVHLQNSKTHALLTGSLTGDLSLEMVPQDANILTGDIALTSGLGGNYPSNIFIGQVLSVQKLENEIFQSASIQAAVDFTRLEAVLVITNFKPVDISPLIPENTP